MPVIYRIGLPARRNVSVVIVVVIVLLAVIVIYVGISIKLSSLNFFKVTLYKRFPPVLVVSLLIYKKIPVTCMKESADLFPKNAYTLGSERIGCACALCTEGEGTVLL